MTDEQKQDNQAIVIPSAADGVIDGSPDHDIIASKIKQFHGKADGKKGFFHKHLCKDCENHKQEAEANKTNWQRALADYKNLQREIGARRAEWAQMSEQQILEEFIPVYDNFKKAFSHLSELKVDNAEYKQIKNWTDGIGYIMKQFGEVLKARGVEEIKTVGEKFDPKFHETVGEEEADQASGTVLREVDGGYKMGKRVFKAAKVVITK